MVGASKFRKAAIKIGLPCASFSRKYKDDSVTDNISSSAISAKRGNVSESSEEGESACLAKNLCAICLETLNCGAGAGQAIFTAQCSHAFHFICISSNVRHGNVTCPICRAHWTQLPRNLTPPCSLPCLQNEDPILRILDDSIATFRVHRRSSLRSVRYDDDDPIEPDPTPVHPRLHFTLVPISPPHPSFPSYSHPPLQLTGPTPHHLTLLSPCGGHLTPHQFTSSSSLSQQNTTPNGQKLNICSNRATSYLVVKLAHQQAIDLILVTSTNGPHLRLLKQAMALVVFSLRSSDRLAIVTNSSSATRAFPLRRMSSHGKRSALQVIDRLFYQGEADPSEGLRKGVKILEDRTHRNPQCCILHLSDSPTRTYHSHNTQVPISIHRFHVGFGFGTSNGFVMHEFEEFLARLLGGVVRETQLRIGEEGVMRLGELRGGEERRIPLDLSDCGFVCVGYSYIEGGVEECLRTGEIVVGIGEKGGRDDGDGDGDGEIEGRDLSVGGRSSSVERWDYHDPYMARRWAKHLHGYRL